MSAEADTASAGKLFIPSLAGFYRSFAQPASWVALRVVVGYYLVLEGWVKIQAPLAQSGFVESIGFYPGWAWSPLLAVANFFGGIAIILGLFTRPAALVNAIMLAVTLWFHMVNPYGDAFLTQAGIEALAADGAQYFTPQGLRRLADGGARFLTQVQHKAEFLSAIWTVAVLFFAGHGGGPLSVDRMLVRKEL